MKLKMGVYTIMDNTLVIGSCRVYKPSAPLKPMGIIRYPGGMIHTPKQVLQVIDIANKDLILEEKDFINIFRVGKPIKNLEEVQIDLNSFDKFVIELASLTDFVSDKYFCHSYKELINVPYKISKYTMNDTIDCIRKIHSKLHYKPILFIQHNNFNKIINLDRYILGYAMASYALSKDNVEFIDLIKYVAEFGAEQTLTSANHHTEFMINQVRSEIIKFARGKGGKEKK